MNKKRKGARWLDVGLERWSYFVGKRFVEVRDSSNNATLIPRAEIDTLISSSGADALIDGGVAATPRALVRYIRSNLRG